MNTDNIIHQANDILAWLEITSDKDLFDALSSCDETIYYALNNDDFASTIYSIERSIFNRDYFNKIVISINNAIDSEAENDEHYSLAA